MKKIYITLVIALFAGWGSLSAQSLQGRYIHAMDLNADDIQVDQIVLSFKGNTYVGEWESALATGENESIAQLSNLLVDEQALSFSFEKDGNTHQGSFIADGKGGYDLILDGQTLFAKEDW